MSGKQLYFILFLLALSSLFVSLSLAYAIRDYDVKIISYLNRSAISIAIDNRSRVAYPQLEIHVYSKDTTRYNIIIDTNTRDIVLNGTCTFHSIEHVKLTKNDRLCEIRVFFERYNKTIVFKKVLILHKTYRQYIKEQEIPKIEFTIWDLILMKWQYALLGALSVIISLFLAYRFAKSRKEREIAIGW